MNEHLIQKCKSQCCPLSDGQGSPNRRGNGKCKVLPVKIEPKPRDLCH